MTLATPEQNKATYRSLHDAIIAKRFQSGSPIRRHAHRSQYATIVELIPAGSRVLDAGCGEGVLSVELAKKGCTVVGVDISEPNIAASKAYAASEGVAERTEFSTADIEHLPFPDKSFDYVVSSHVLEHVPDFVQAAKELNRVGRKCVITAIPTCLDFGAMVLLGGDKYWMLSRKSVYALPYGFLRVVWALCTGREGVNEGYEGDMSLIHIWRFPWRGRQLMEAGGLRVLRYGGSAVIFPYCSLLLPLSRLLERLVWLPLLRNVGYGTTYVCEPK
jgi:SAM-dependent methyltransferase